MFFHNFKYAFFTLFKNKTLIFWTFAFPIILAIFFNMAFSNLNDSEKLDIIPIAIIDDDEFNNNEVFTSAFQTLSDKDNKDRLFDTTYTTEENAKILLSQEKIIGYMKLIDNEPVITFLTSGIEQTVFKYVSEEILQTNNMVKNISEEEINKAISKGNYQIDYESIYQNVYKLIDETDIKLTHIENNNLDYSMIEYYTLIAMACMYGGIIGMVAINQNLANMSNKGKRVAVSPTKKQTVIVSSLLTSYIVQLIGLFLLFIITLFILKVDYGNNILYVILLSLVGSFAGLSFGVALGTILKGNDNTKTGILIASTMLGCFFAGMFGISMKYIVDKNFGIINKLNPVAMITDGLYSLYYYDTYSRYWFNIISLLIFAFVLILISFINLRRKKYDSI